MPTISAADYQAQHGIPRKPAKPPTPPAPADSPAAPVAALLGPETNPGGLRYAPGFTVVERTDSGARFVAFDLTPAQTQGLCDAARRLGIPPTDNRSFITESKSH